MKACIYLPGDVIIAQGMEGNALYFISRGKVDVMVGSKRVASLAEYDFFGEQSFLEGTEVGATIVACEMSELMLLFRSDFVYLLQFFPELAEYVRRARTSRSESTRPATRASLAPSTRS